MPGQRAGYDSPTQTGGYDSDRDDPWFDYDAQQEETESESEGELMGNSLSRPYTPTDPRLYSPSRVFSRSNSSRSFSVLSSEFPPLSRSSPQPFFEPLTPSTGLEQPPTPLPSLHEWFVTGQPLYSILSLPANDTNDSPPANDTNYSLPANRSPASPSAFGVLLREPSPAAAISQPPAAVTDARGTDVHSLTLSQFFDEQSAREISATLAEYQRSDEPSPSPEEAAGFEPEEPEERFILREEDIHLSAIRERSVLEMAFAREMPTPEASPKPEEDPAAAPLPGYVPPAQFEPPYEHPPYSPPQNEGRLPYSAEPLTYLATALQMHEAQLKWCLLHRPMECFHHLVGMTVYCLATKRFSTVAHLTALTPETHVSVSGTTYYDYLRDQCGFTVSAEHKSSPMLELGDHFLAPLESLVLYWHV
ncbi:hypothetical protein AAVH_18754 [Aphelenchoides avenae]|nr:hypothetical protein AAVH_18754 [Aphelenchus avenae]